MQKWRDLNWTVLFLLYTLLFIGVVAVSSASSTATTPYLFAKKQMIWIMIGSCIFMGSLFISYQKICEYSYAIYGFCLGLLVLTLLIGVERNNAKCWINLGFMELQASELMKIAVILCLAKYLMYREDQNSWTGLVQPFFITATPLVLILKQPDFGTSMMFFPVLFACLYLSGARTKHLLIIVGCGIMMLPVLYYNLKTYQQQRIDVFLYQDSLTPEQIRKHGYHLHQSKIAIGSGGFMGQGFREGTQNRLNLLPERHTDFIFAVIGEEFGFVGCAIVLLLYFLLFAACLSVADNTKEPFGRIVVVGIVTLLFAQVFVNTGMTVGLMPITGITLPFLSYGGSSLVSSMLAISLVLNIGMHRVHVIGRESFTFGGR